MGSLCCIENESLDTRFHFIPATPKVHIDDPNLTPEANDMNRELFNDRRLKKLHFRKKIKVVVNGCEGEYSGEVNDEGQAHGIGFWSGEEFIFYGTFYRHKARGLCKVITGKTLLAR